jgi:hypothetical protein
VLLDRTQDEYLRKHVTMLGREEPSLQQLRYLCWCHPELYLDPVPDADQRVLYCGSLLLTTIRRTRPRCELEGNCDRGLGESVRGAFNNGTKALPAIGDYGYDGLPFMTPFDSTFGGYYANKQIRTAGDNITKLIGQHTLRAGLYYQ